MLASLFQQISKSPDAMLKEQYDHLRAQIPLMYLLMLVNACFLAAATIGEVPKIYGLGIPALLCTIIVVRMGVWVARRGRQPGPAQIRRYLYGTTAAGSALSAAFGGWGLLLLQLAQADRSTAIALYVFVGAICACYCLQALPLAAWLVLLCGALPITIRLLFSHDWYAMGIGWTFILAAGILLKTLANNHSAFKELLQSRIDMGSLIVALEQSQEHYRHSVDLNPQIPWLADPEGRLTELSPRWSAITGMATQDALGIGWASALHPEDLPAVQQVWTRALSSGGESDADVRYRLRQWDGGWRWYRARAFPRRDAAGKVLSWYGSLEDIEEQVLGEKALQDSEERYRLASLASNDIIMDIALDRDHVDWGGATATIFGHDAIVGGTSRRWWIKRIHPDDRPMVLARLRRISHPVPTEETLSHWRQEFRFQAADRSFLNLIARGHVVRDEAGDAIRLIGTLQDVTARKRDEDRLRWAAHHDALTQLPNRVLFAESLDRALAEARLNRRHVGLIVLDVDRFKAVNDSLGHDAGDSLLREVAARLTRYAPFSATVARLGGDEFAIILPDLPSPEARTRIAERLAAQVAGPMGYEGRQIDVSLSIGSAVAFDDGESPEELHKSADLALYAAKNDGLGQLRQFSTSLRKQAARRTQMLADARTTLREDGIVPFYQPKVSLRTGACVGFEALLRWHAKGLQSPGGIQAAFDDPGLSVQLTDRMLDRVVADMASWQRRGIAFHSVAVNGSAGDFMRGDFAERILGRLRRAGLPPSSIELEVTETVFLGQLVENVSSALGTLSRAGVSIALDDFGTGYASLTHLKQFPVDSLKIDRSFVERLGMVETEDAAIVGAVIDLGRNLGIRTVAEGIETSEQLSHLAAKGCDIGQGFLLGRPMAAPQVVEALTHWDVTRVATLCASADWAEAVRSTHQDRFA
ncbi:putative bifunctional diguanylate cyclase/phosphodiesterase [Novosphingobium rosa]|uniref:putative bifunctional diguanylate cyclase/phosphodiesterase n=1 Tax=Novosphingobium rosa TaxID=76978 RepID=UPI00082E7577|nr:EAL domain-containing protein [Novosphingobium rosa]